MTALPASEWANSVELPPVSEMELIGSPTADIFIQQGTRMAGVIRDNISDFFGGIPENLSVLDFGCGVGRVLLPLSRTTDAKWFACDVNHRAIDYLKRAVSDVEATNTGYYPPLPYDDNSFDCVYSISIWTHFPIGMQLPWLSEIKRILRPNGLALITTAGQSVLELQKQRRPDEWKDVTAQSLVDSGIIFRRYKHEIRTPGITGPYGLTCHSPDFVSRVWSRVMPVLTTKLHAIEGSQDLHILTKV